MATNQELEEQLAVAREDIRKLSQMAGSRLRDEAHERRDEAQMLLGELSAETREIYNNAVREGQRMRATTEDTIRTHPLGSIGLAFAAGMVVSSLMGRR